MQYTITHEPTPENISVLINAAHETQPELETIIRIAYEAGIKNSIARHLGPKDLVGTKMAFQHPLSKGPILRLLPDSLLGYLQKLP